MALVISTVLPPKSPRTRLRKALHDSGESLRAFAQAAAGGRWWWRRCFSRPSFLEAGSRRWLGAREASIRRGCGAVRTRWRSGSWRARSRREGLIASTAIAQVGFLACSTQRPAAFGVAPAIATYSQPPGHGSARAVPWNRGVAIVTGFPAQGPVSSLVCVFS